MNIETVVAAAIGGVIGVFLNGLFTFLQRRADMKYKNAEIRGQLIRESNERQATAVGDFIDAYRSIKRDAAESMAREVLTNWESEAEKRVMRMTREFENSTAIRAAFDVLRLAVVHPKMQPVIEKLQDGIGKFYDDFEKVVKEENTYNEFVRLGDIDKDVSQLLATANKHLVYNPAVDPFPGFFIK